MKDKILKQNIWIKNNPELQFYHRPSLANPLYVSVNTLIYKSVNGIKQVMLQTQKQHTRATIQG